MGDFAQVFGGLLHAANEKTASEKQKFETQRDADVSMYRQIMLDPHAGLGPDADEKAVEERRVKLAGDMAKLQNLKGKDTPLHHLAEMLNGVRRAVKARRSGVGTNPDGTPIVMDPGMSGTPKPQGASGGGAEPIPNAKPGDGAPEPIPNVKPGQEGALSPLAQDTQKIQQKTQSLGGKILTKVAHGLGGGLTALDSTFNSKRYDTAQLPSLDASVLPTAPTREQDAAAQGRADKAKEESGHTNELKRFREDLKAANPNMTDEQLDHAVETKYGAVPKPKLQTKKVADPESPTGFSYVTYDSSQPDVITSKVQSAPSGDSNSVSEQIVIDPKTNQMVAVPIYRSTTHGAKGGSTAGAGSKKAGLTPLTGGAAGAGAGAGAGAKPQAKAAGAPGKTSGHGRVIGDYIRPQQFNALNTQATAIDEARNSLVGDDPKSVGGLAGDLAIFDNPDSVQRVMQFLGFVEKNVSGEANRAAGGGPLAAAEWYTQLPVTVSNLQQQAQQELAMELTPEEQQFVTDYFRVMGTIGGLRAATKMPGSRWSFMNLYNELPTPGRVNNKQDAMRRIKNILQETNVVSQHNPMSKSADLTALDAQGGEKKFRDNGKVYTIPAGMVGEFQKDHPKAVAVQ